MTVEDKQKNLKMLLAVCAAALAVIAVLLLLFLSGQAGRQHEEIVLPESYPEAEPPAPETGGETETVLTVSADIVQAILQSMSRLSAFHQTFTVTQRSGTHARTSVVDIWASGGLVRAEIADEYETKSILTDGETVYVWYDNGDTPVALQVQDGSSYEDLAGLPTYEDLIRLPGSAVREGGFLADAQSGADLVYARVVTDGAEQQYWVSTDTGLLYRQTTTVDGTVVYEAEQTFLDVRADGDDTLSDMFRLPDGSSPF